MTALVHTVQYSSHFAHDESCYWDPTAQMTRPWFIVCLVLTKREKVVLVEYKICRYVAGWPEYLAEYGK